MHGWRWLLVDLFEGVITWRCRPGELSVGHGGGQVRGFGPGWRAVLRPRGARRRGGLVGRGDQTGSASSSVADAVLDTDPLRRVGPAFGLVDGGKGDRQLVLPPAGRGVSTLRRS